MKREIDKLGRIVIPKEMRNELGVINGDPVDIELVGKKVIITNPNKVDYKAIIEEALMCIDNCIGIEVKEDLKNILNKGVK